MSDFRSGEGATDTTDARVSTADTEPGRVGRAKAAARSAASDAASRARTEASNLRGQAEDRARSYAVDAKGKATDALDGVVDLLTDAAAQIDERLGGQYGGYARQAAEFVSDFADRMRDRDVDDLVADARGFVRKSPAVAIGAAAAVGFVLARLVKSGWEEAATLGTDPDRNVASTENDVVFTPAGGSVNDGESVGRAL